MSDIFQLLHRRLITDGRQPSFAFVISFLVYTLGISSLVTDSLFITHIRIVCGFILCCVIPGLLLSKLFSIEYDKVTNIILYVSTSIVLVTGVFSLLSAVSQSAGIKKPLSEQNVLITMYILNLLLYFLSGRPKFTIDSRFYDKLFDTKIVLISLLILTISYFAVYFRDLYDTTVLFYPLFVLIALVSVIVISSDSIKSADKSLVIFSSSLGLLYHRSLISSYVSGWDIQISYFFAQNTLTLGYWDPTISGLNTLPTISVLPSVYSLMFGVSIHSIFKIIFPIFFALSPVAVYLTTSSYFANSQYDLAALFYVFYSGFISVIPSKQRIAMLFVSVLILVAIKDTNNTERNKIYYFIISSGIILSHYSTSIIFIFILALKKVTSDLFSLSPIDIKKQNNSLGTVFILLFTVLFFTWSIYIGSEWILEYIVQVMTGTITNLEQILLEGQERTGRAVVSQQSNSSLVRQVRILFTVFVQALAAIGAVHVTFRIFRTNDTIDEYTMLILSSFALFSISVFVSSGFGTGRMLLLVLTIMSPLYIVGTLAVLNSTFNYFVENKTTKKNILKSSISVILIIMLVFSSGIAYTAAGISSTDVLDNNRDSPIFNEREYRSTQWTLTHMDDSDIYTDAFGYLLFIQFEGPNPENVRRLSPEPPNEGDRYVLLHDISGETIPVTVGFPPEIKEVKTDSYLHRGSLNNHHKIYTNGHTDVVY